MPRHPARRRHNLPAHRVRLIGREHDLAAARRALLDTEGRLLTLTGTGGCGKTRLGLGLASGVLDTFPDGVWFVELAPLSDPSHVALVIMSALGLREQLAEAPAQTLVRWIGARRLLLVLDNCEHLVDACASLAEALLDACPNLRVLATSRQPLRITGEVTWRVPSLSLPAPGAPPADVLATPAVQLFVERARAAEPDFPAAARANAIARICARLDGLPLAIELAAARVRTLGVEQIVGHLDDSIRLLIGGSRTAPTRQQTLRATLDWSYGLLSDLERAVFGRLAVFAADCSLDAAEAVCAAGDVAPSDVLDLLGLLVDKSLVAVDERDGLARYRLLEPVRQYAYEHLVASGERDLVRRRHAEYSVAYVEARHVETNRGGARRRAATGELGREYPDIRAALAWCVEVGEPQVGLRLAGSLLFLWQIRGFAGEGLAWLGHLLALPGAKAPTAARARGLVAAARLAQLCGDFGASQAFGAEALSLARAVADPLLELLALQFAAVHGYYTGDLVSAERAAREAAACARAAGDRVGEGQALLILALQMSDQADYTTAGPLVAEGLRLARLEGDVWNEGWALAANGRVALGQGAYKQAQDFMEAGLTVARQQGEPPSLTAFILDDLGELATLSDQPQQARAALLNSLELRYAGGERHLMALTLERLAALEALSARPERALHLAGAAEALYASLDAPRSASECQRLDRWLPAVRASLETAAAERAWAEGLALGLEDALALARTSEEPAGSGRVPAIPGLTSREQEVVVLLARGLSNRQIAEELVISAHTAQRHVENILGKLGFSSRTQVATWAVGQGFVAASTASTDLPA